jgi:translation initiation factor IF-2
MAEEKMMRLSQAAKKLNVGIARVIEILDSAGHRVENNPNAKLAFDQLEILAKELGSPELTRESGTPSPAVETKSSDNEGDSEILYFREQPKATEPKAAEQKAPEPEIIKIETHLTGPKVLGKIDLNAKGEVKIKPIDEKPEPKREEPKIEEPKAETPKIEEPKVEAPKIEVSKVEEPKVEVPKVEVPKAEEPKKVEGPKKEEPKIETPKVEAPVIETPKVETPKAVEAPKEEKQPAPVKELSPKEEVKAQQLPVEVKKPEPVNNPAPVEEPKKEVPQEAELIKAHGDKLQGLVVLGKIQLPVEKKLSKEDKQKRKRKRVLVGGEKVGDTSSKSNFGNFKPRESGAPGAPGQNNPRSPYGQNRDANKPGGPGANRPTNPRPTTPGAAPAAGTGTGSGNNAPGKAGGRKDFRKDKREFVSESDVKDSIKSTLNRMQTKGNDFGSKYRKQKRRDRADAQDARDLRELEESGILKVTEYISAAELASLMNVSVNEVIAACMRMGIFASINQRLDAETIQMVSLEFNYEVEFISAEDEVSFDTHEEVDAEEDLLPRAPIVTIMGHVDHGKTSLLDYIRRAKVASGEAGGITQHIGAYSVNIKEGPNKGKSITFLDTPGHEAFTAMRARGAKVTDIVIIVVAADDSVMPQTREAINHAQNAGVPIVFALNKIDKPGANPDKIREDLSKENILVESWGGKFQEQEVSAKSGLGVDDLLDKVLLEAELLELKANPERKASGTVIEASLDKGRGYVSTILVETGTLKVGDIVLAGQYFGRVRAMVSDLGAKIKEAGPSVPVQILGLPGAPQAGDKFNIMETEREAREIANKREQLNREMSIRAKKHITLDEIGRRKAIGSFKELNVIIKGDVDGSVEALADSLLKLSTAEVQVNIVHKGVGQISESDVTLASAADAIVIGFQVRPSNNARRIADNEEIEIRLYSIIYDAINEIKDAMEGLLAPKFEEVVTGNIEVREVFKISKVGTIAGSYVTDGYVKRNNKVRVIREGIVLHEGEIAQLKRYKDDVAEVKAGYECGISITKFNDIQEGDIIESFEIRELKRTL